MSGQTPFEGEGDWSDPIPPQQPPQSGADSGPSGSPPPYHGSDRPPGYQAPAPPPSQSYGGQPLYGQPASPHLPPGPGAAGGRPNINNFLIPAIASTVLCCPPTGIAAIVFASQVNTKLSQGDVVGAQESANKARTWTYVTVAAGVAVGLLWFFSVLVSSGSSY